LISAFCEAQLALGKAIYDYYLSLDDTGQNLAQVSATHLAGLQVAEKGREKLVVLELLSLTSFRKKI
jgi:hypothetical protein